MNTTAHSDARQRILDTAQLIIGKKGFSAVGLNEVLQAVKIPKGSFYHYFSSKDAFGEALLESYFASYLAWMEQIFQAPNHSAKDQLMSYWQRWHTSQSSEDVFGKCLAVKLGAEVADLSEAMRLALDRGTAAIIERLATALSEGIHDGSLNVSEPPGHIALQLYQMWLGASVMAKITRTAQPFDEAMAATRRILNDVKPDQLEVTQ